MASRNNTASDGMLSPYRVLDLSRGAEIIGAKILGDLGADVMSVEPPAGVPLRRMSPFYCGAPHQERSLWWWAYAAGRRSVTLDIGAADGQAILKRLVSSADFLFESFPPGYLAGLGLAYEDLRRVNPRLIMASMTPFGQTGPYAAYQSPDLVGMAAGGFMHLTGDPDLPPVRVTLPQFGLHMGASGAAGVMIAHHHRLLGGQGQRVDVSGQEAVARTLSHAPSYWDLNRTNLSRLGVYRPGLGGGRSRTTWQCKDGYVNFSLSSGPLGGGTNSLVQWMQAEGFNDEFLASVDWTQVDTNQDAGIEAMTRAAEPIQAFFLAHTKQELYEGAVARRVQLFPVNTAADIRQEAQLAARGYFVPILHEAEGATFDYPGAFVRSSEASIGPRSRAPYLGEHNRDVYCGELGNSASDLVLLREGGVI
ncbi:MAG: CoA transferase [Chloroflexi bacterium]|nr:CoA transferase [Chloroflexota bacterium]